MRPTTTPLTTPTDPLPAIARIGCVSYLNAKPLIEGLDQRDDCQVHFDVPARLLGDLEAGCVDIALCPVIDFFRSHEQLVIVPVGAIGSHGPTLTVRLFSKVPIDRITTIHADRDSHTSVALVQILLKQTHGLTPTIIDFDPRRQPTAPNHTADPQTLLLIGDKVVTAPPTPQDYRGYRGYPHQLDLGQAWRDLTGLPFVFAIWMARRGIDLGQLPQILLTQRLSNDRQLDKIVQRHAAAHGWPIELARDYLQHILHYDIAKDQWQAIKRFGQLAADQGLIENYRELELYVGHSF